MSKHFSNFADNPEYHKRIENEGKPPSKNTVKRWVSNAYEAAKGMKLRAEYPISRLLIRQTLGKRMWKDPAGKRTCMQLIRSCGFIPCGEY